ncbi:MAG: ThuA domain-containing protein [Candidatus Sulfotelmatobacter sp.]
MKRRFAVLTALLVVLFLVAGSVGQQSPLRVLAFYSPTAELDHVQFAESALTFFGATAAKDKFTFESTTNWADLNPANLKKYQIIVWLTDSPSNAEQRHAFEQYMESGGAWLGFHAAGYNDKDTNWPWYVDFLGGAVFDINSWPPLPANLVVDDRSSPLTTDVPANFVSPANEWYVWKPSPRLDKDVRVLVTLDPANYPLGLKDVIMSGDLPVVWTNTKYKMIYMNMGHGDKIFNSATQNKLIEDGLLSLGPSSVPVDRSPASGLRISPRAIVVNPKTHKVYGVNTQKGTVTVIDGVAHSTTMVKVGDEPAAIAINPDTNKIYVGNGGSGTVSVIDGATNAVTATIPVGELPYVVAVNSATNRVYVSKTFSNTLTVIDGKTNRTNILKVAVQADAIAVDPVANKIYLTSYESKTLTVIDGASDRFTTLPADFHLWGIAVNPATSRVYLTSTGSSKLTVIDGMTSATVAVETGKIPCAVAVDPAANRIYTANYGTDTVSVIDGVSNSVIATVPVGEHPQALAVNPETHTIYVANTHSGTVTVIDGTRNTVVTIAGNGPYAIAVDAATNKAYVASLAGKNITIIDGNTLGSSPATTR